MIVVNLLSTKCADLTVPARCDTTQYIRAVDVRKSYAMDGEMWQNNAHRAGRIGFLASVELFCIYVNYLSLVVIHYH